MSSWRHQERLLLLVAFSIVVASCCAPNGGYDDGGQGSSSSGGGSSTGTGSGSSTTSGGLGSTGGSTSSGKPYLGSIEFLDQSESYWEANAGFLTTALKACAGGTVQGSCCYLSADAGGYAPLAPASGDISAGEILLEDGSTIIAILNFERGYQGIDTMTNLDLHWSPGDTLGVYAAGDANGIGSFSGCVVAPTELEGVNPTVAMVPMVSRAADFDITWNTTAASCGTVTLEITALEGEAFGFDGAIACSASSASGALSVPAALVGVLPSGDTALLDLILSTDSVLEAANATVDLIAVEQVFGTSTIE